MGFVRRLRAKSIGSSSQEIENKEKDSRQCMARQSVSAVGSWRGAPSAALHISLCWKMLGVNLEPVVIKEFNAAEQMLTQRAAFAL